MVRQRSFEHIHEIALAGHDGGRLNQNRRDPVRDSQLAGELQQAVGEDQERLALGLLHASNNSLRQIADIIGKRPSTVHRTTPTAMRFLRVYFIVTLIEEWIDDCGGCLLSLQTAKTINWEYDGYLVTSPERRQSMQIRPGENQLIRILKRQRQLLELASDLEATNNVPYVACWYDKNVSRWFVDFPLCFSNREEAVVVAKEIKMSTIYHVASGRIEFL